jgi:hypothetical protein
MNQASMQSRPTSSEMRSVSARRRWVKVDVDETTFLTMHDCANKSRMRVSMYLRTLLNEANVYHHRDGVPFESPSASATAS